LDKPTLLIQGSSWTVGAYQKSQTPFCDELVPGGLGQLLSNHFNVTNISTQDDFNLGISWRLQEHLKTNCYDKIIVCQNDALLDVDVLTSNDKSWANNFNFKIDDLIQNNIDTIQKYISFSLNLFYSQLPDNTYIFAGPSYVVSQLALQNNLHPIQPDWTKCLVPGHQPGYTYNCTKLMDVCNLLISLFPENKFNLKQEFLKFSDDIDLMINAWKRNPEYFAYFHPTALGNKIFFETIIEQI